MSQPNPQVVIPGSDEADDLAEILLERGEVRVMVDQGALKVKLSGFGWSPPIGRPAS